MKKYISIMMAIMIWCSMCLAGPAYEAANSQTQTSRETGQYYDDFRIEVPPVNSSDTQLHETYAVIGGSIYNFAPDEKISVVLDGNEIEFDQPPIIIDDRTMVPLRAIFEALGAKVYWDGDTQTVTSVKDDVTVMLTIGLYEFYRNGVVIPLDVPGMIINDRTLVPVRAVSEAFSCQVNWDGATKTVDISYDNGSDTSDILWQYAKENLSVLYQDDYTGKRTYTDVRFLLADVSGDNEPELLAVGVNDNYMGYLEIYRYENGSVVKILSDYFGAAQGRLMDLVRYNGGVRVYYEHTSSATGFRVMLMRYENGEWVEDYNSYQDIDLINGLKHNGYVVNGEYVSEETYNADKGNMANNTLTLSDFAGI